MFLLKLKSPGIFNIKLHVPTSFEGAAKDGLTPRRCTVPALKLELFFTLVNPPAGALAHTQDGVRVVPTHLHLFDDQVRHHIARLVTLGGRHRRDPQIPVKAKDMCLQFTCILLYNVYYILIVCACVNV